MHFIGSIKESFVSLIVGLLLFLVVSILSCFIRSPDTDQAVSFLAGIAASIIATLVFRVSERYLSSCHAYSKILSQANNIITYIDTDMKSAIGAEIHKFKLWEMYIDICERSRSLSYKKDYLVIVKAIYNLVDIVFHDCGSKSIEKAKEQLQSAIGGTVKE